jgi:hypothetical protein
MSATCDSRRLKSISERFRIAVVALPNERQRTGMVLALAWFVGRATIVSWPS